ncbi:hypothetical protein BH10PAT1_BH10PAT1_7530 [soil metagenome]
MTKFLLLTYKKFVSPIFVILFGHSCRFSPTCSEYAAEAISKYGIVKGGFMSVKRIIRCNPFSRVKYDPVI